MLRPLVRHAYGITVLALVTAILVLGAFIAANIVLPELAAGNDRLALGPTATPQAQPSAAADGSATASAPPTMRGLVLPDTADCSACHLTSTGQIGLKPIPPMGHPLQGWTDCTACHAPAGLVKTAPGHSGIHASDCLTCHQPGNLPPPLSRPHRELQNTNCLSCHGSKAPLPADMAHRSQSVCWLCHRLPAEQPPVPAHPTVNGETDCLSCHVSGKVGALPADHASRTASECLLCHELPIDRAPQNATPSVRLSS